METSCTSKIAILTIVLVVVIIFSNSIFTTLPMLKLLFTDQVSFILLSILCVFVILVDLPSGIVLSIIVVILGLNISSPTNSSNPSNSTYGNKDRFYNVATDNRQFTSDSEIFYNKTEPAPNGNLSPFQVPNSPMEQTPKGMIPVNSNKVMTKSCTDPDFITRVGLPNRDGYDVIGCRYDMKDSPQNATIYGPPLAQCGAYSGKSFSCTGTLFYPLNE